jgi:hypothetical protein
VGARFSALVQTGPEAHPTSHTMRTVSFPEVKRQGRGADHTSPSSAEVKERVELYLYPPLWIFMARSRVNFTFYVHTQAVGSLYGALIYIDIDISVNCNWVHTRWQYTFTHKQYIEHHN